MPVGSLAVRGERMNGRGEFDCRRRPSVAMACRVSISRMKVLRKLVSVLIVPREVEHRYFHVVDTTQVPGVQRDKFCDDVLQYKSVRDV